MTQTTEKIIYRRPEVLQERNFHFCPGCGHGIAHRILAEALEESGMAERAVGVSPVGCGVVTYFYIGIDWQEAPHGRAPAVATGIKRSRPDLLVLTYQGDGDLAAIGTGEFVHCANRGENITSIFINNGLYAMTAGQMAPTTPIGRRTSTTPKGRTIARDGYPLRVCEMLAPLDGTAYLERIALTDPKSVRQAKKGILKAFQYQMEGRGYTLIELLSPCPTHWRMKPVDAIKRIKEEVLPIFPTGVIKDVGK
ncbi:MAG TPA: thiamine pyrophosphate-dependent enzyme [Candidatus Brocadiia bacterium]|nr:thiamine pyrophosphate-dependent enzyme [Candidatus Brocadiia bacterium]